MISEVHGSEKWLVTDMDIKRLDTWERKILSRMYGAVAERPKWRIGNDQELWEFYKDLDIVLHVKKKRLGMDRTSSTNVS